MTLRKRSPRVGLLPLLALGVAATAAYGAAALSRDGSQFRITTPLVGDQVHAQVALGGAGGYLVWEDNNTDGLGLGISARRVDPNLSGVQGSFRVNQTAAGDQEKPRVAMLANEGAVFVWQGGTAGFQRIYARFVNAAGTFVSGDIKVNTHTGQAQTEPAVAATADGNAIVIWSSFAQDGSLSGVYGQRLSATGQKLGTEFRINATTQFNQRSPAVAALPQGGFIVAWITEARPRIVLNIDASGLASDPSSGAQEFDVQLMARRFDAAGAALVDEYAVSSNGRIAANPAIAVASDGSVAFVWGSRAPQPAGSVRTKDGWDISCIVHGPDGAPTSGESLVNTHIRGDQFLPRVAAVGSRFLAIWSSLGQDGSREGVFGRAIAVAGPVADEAQINTEAAGQQIYPAVASSGNGTAIVAWSSFMGGDESFDLFAQRIVEAPGLEAPAAPYIFATSPGALSISWPAVEGLGVVTYQLYIDGNPAVESTANHHSMEGLMPGSTHSCKLAYRLEDGRVSGSSADASGRVWDLDRNYDGLPDDWQTKFWPGIAKPPGAGVDTDGDGALNFQELLAGTDPTQAGSVLKLVVDVNPQGAWLGWNTQPGASYQVQSSSNLGEWAALGPERFAADTTDSIPVDAGNNVQMYRIVRIR